MQQLQSLLGSSEGATYQNAPQQLLQIHPQLLQVCMLSGVPLHEKLPCLLQLNCIYLTVQTVNKSNSCRGVIFMNLLYIFSNKLAACTGGAWWGAWAGWGVWRPCRPSPWTDRRRSSYPHSTHKLVLTNYIARLEGPCYWWTVYSGL